MVPGAIRSAQREISLDKYGNLGEMWRKNVEIRGFIIIVTLIGRVALVSIYA